MFDNILAVTDNANGLDADPTTMVYDEYMGQIIKQIPSAGDLKLLIGTANAQASFYFKSPDTSEINANLYNNLLSARIQGEGTEPGSGVGQVGTLQATFINAYNQVYTSLRYQLSQKDQATQQKLIAETAASVTTLRPIWNGWVDAFGDDKVVKLNMSNTATALIQLTAVVQTQWINPKYVDVMKADPSYPYQHMNDFDTIFSEIPATVPMQMRNSIKDVYNVQGAAGGLTSQVSNATQTLNNIIGNIQRPSLENGGLKLTGSTKMIPGMTFQPDNPLVLVTELAEDPPTGTLSYSAEITKLEKTQLTVEASVGGGINIPILSFFSVGVSGGAQSSIFEEDYAGSKYSVSIVVNNPTLQPLMTVEALKYNISTGQGWMNADPVLNAIKNGSTTDVTGYVFDGKPSFDFGKDGNFGYINTLVYSQFLEIEIVFEQCDSKKVEKYFEQHSSASISFLGIPLGGASESSSYSYSYSSKTESTITVTLKPNPPGYIPGTSDITQTLCQLIAVAVTYPCSAG